MLVFGSEIIKKLGVTVSKGTNVVEENDTSRELYVVHKGALEVVKNINGMDQVLTTIEAGEFFGELSLLNNEPRTATVRAMEESVLLKVSPKAFEMLVRKMPDLSLKVIMALAARLRASTEKVASLQETDEDMKFYKTILSKVNTMGHETVKGIRVSVTMESIAKELNTSAEMFKGIKKDLRNATNVIHFLEEGSFEIPDRDILIEFIDFVGSRKRLTE